MDKTTAWVVCIVAFCLCLTICDVVKVIYGKDEGDPDGA